MRRAFQAVVLSSFDLGARLREAIRLARASGLNDAADELESRCFAAYTTSSEWLGEVGFAILEFVSRTRGQIPSECERELYDCLAEVRKVWPDVGKSVTRRGRPTDPAGSRTRS